MRNSRAHTRPDRNHDTGFDAHTTTSHPDEAWHSLDLETQAYQAQLETARRHPDNEEAQQDLEKARATMEQAWLEHAVGTVTSPTVTRTSFLLSIGVAGVSYLRLALLHVHAHRWRT